MPDRTGRATPWPILLIAITGVLVASGGIARAESVLMTMDRPTLLNFLRAATPYDIEVSKAGLTETLTLYNPRELRFADGKIHLKVDCRGTPIPVEAILEPTVNLYFDRNRGSFVAEIESLPVDLGIMGRIYLERFLDPIVIPAAFSRPLDLGIPGLTVETVVRQLSVTGDRIEARADLLFHKVPPDQRAAATP